MSDRIPTERIIAGLNSEGKECTCCAHTWIECCCDAESPDQWIGHAALRLKELEAELAAIKDRDPKADKFVIDMLNAEVAVLKSSNKELEQTLYDYKHEFLPDHQAKIKSLQAELAACKADALRYRWLIENDALHAPDDEMRKMFAYGKNREIDAAIDAAMKGST